MHLLLRTRCIPNNYPSVRLPLYHSKFVSRVMVSCRTQARHASQDVQRARTRNIGIIAHIDAGKTTTTERMLYYSGFTRRIGDVDDGSTVTDFLPAERARGITIQSAAVTFQWPPEAEAKGPSELTDATECHTVNLIDTPGHADFTFEVIRSLRILDGALCILDGVAGVEAQTEKVWTQANNYQIPRIVFINKLDRDGAAFHRSVKEIAMRLHTWPALCQIPWWKNGRFVGVGNVIDCCGISWEESTDGRHFDVWPLEKLDQTHKRFAEELRRARQALIEVLTEHDDALVEAFLESDENFEALPARAIWQSMRRILLSGQQLVTPVFAGASFRNIGVQPMLDAVNILLPSPQEAVDPSVSLGEQTYTLRQLLRGDSAAPGSRDGGKGNKTPARKAQDLSQQLSTCSLAFKVVNDFRRGIFIYVRVYSGSLKRNALLYNTNLGVTERAQRLMRMYANDAVEVESIEEGQIGVIVGLKHARTGDTLVGYSGLNSKSSPPPPYDSLQLQPIAVPPPLFFTSIEPASLSEERALDEALSVLLREDPSLSVVKDADSGQTQLAGMGELHLEIARDRLLNEYKVKASMGKIEIGYREAIVDASEYITRSYEREISGKQVSASCTASVSPIGDIESDEVSGAATERFVLPDSNILTVEHPLSEKRGKSTSSQGGLPSGLTLRSVMGALRSGATAALARGPAHSLPVHSTHVSIRFDPSQHVTPVTEASTLTTAARLTVAAALKNAASKQSAVMMEPVMLATISVNESAIGDVVHDLHAARGAQVLTLDANNDDDSEHTPQATNDLDSRRLNPTQIDKVYAPPDPFGSTDAGTGTYPLLGSMQMRQLKARVPLKEMVGYLKHLRSLTGGRGSFVMSVDRFERMTTQRMRSALSEIRGDYV